MTMEGGLTLGNMSIGGGARFGYVTPDKPRYDYLRDRQYSPQGAAFDRAVTWWQGMASDPEARYDDVKRLDGSAIPPMVTWGINPGQSVGVGERIPNPETAPEQERATYREGLAHMGFEAGQPIAGAKIDVVFIGSCTNSRISDLRVAAAGAQGNPGAKGVRAIALPGAPQAANDAGAEGPAPVLP